ncbi:MAG: hypothetical protein IKJ65_08690 [Clostridia bacterium]|nr:hypothetical protein [Clostridia bacterium]
MNNKDYQKAVPDMPLSFARKMDETLERIENMEMKKRKFTSRTLVICAILVVTLIGSAIAASEYKVFDFLWHMNPLEGAENLIETNVGVYENEYVRVAIEEAAYDGQGVMLYIRATPLKPETHPLYSLLMNTENDSDWVYKYTEYEDGSGMGEFLGRADGKEFVSFGVSVTVKDENGKEIWLDAWDAKKEADGSVILYADGFSEEKLGDTAVLTAKVRSHLCAPDATKKTSFPEGEIIHTMPKVDVTRNYKLIPVSTEEIAHFDLIEGEISFTPVRGYMKIRYAYQEREDEPMGVTMKLCLPDGAEIYAGSAGSNLIGKENGFEIWEELSEIQSCETLPETITIRVKVIGEARYLCDVECRVVAE